MLEPDSVNNFFDSISDNIVSNNPDNSDVVPDIPDSNMPLKRYTIPGDFLLKGMFTHDSNVTFDQDGEVFQLEDFDDMKDASVLATETRFKMTDTDSSTWPTTNDVYQHLSVSDSPFTNSSMFTTPFLYDTLITGKVHFLTHINTTNISPLQNFTLRISLSIYDPVTYNLTEILNYEEILSTGLLRENQKVFDFLLNETYMIPANNRLKLEFEGKVLNTALTGKVDLYSSKGGPVDYQWIIDDGEYSKNYTFSKYTYVLGMQMKYRSIKYPDIYVFGAENNTYYTVPTNVTINTVGAVNSSFKWDSDAFTYFTDSVSTPINETEEAWHYLEIKALDEFNNTRFETYRIGYDPTANYLLLHTPANNSLIPDNSLLNFSLVGFSAATYEWDDNGIVFDLIEPEYDIYSPIENGWRNLSFNLTNIFGTEVQYYAFEIDSLPPLILLYNVVDNTNQPANKLIEVNITDVSSSVIVEHKWDDNILLPWSPSTWTIYKTYLPSSPGWHTLTVIAEDDFGHIDTQYFAFNTSEDSLLVELRTMTNESWYYGGNVVEVTTSGTNGTILFKWDNDSFQNGTPLLIDDYYIRLDGANALSTDPSTVHYLTIIVGDSDNTEHTYVFEFQIDQENPVFDPAINDYNGERYTTSDILNLTISDNNSTASELVVWISIDGQDNYTLQYEFDIDLSSLGDGLHNIALYVFDIASNNASIFISFYIDTQGPEILSDIEGLFTLLDETDIVPYNSTVNVIINDEDPSYSTYYSWDGANYILFSDSFNLDYAEGLGILLIYANDSLGNDHLYNHTIYLDNSAPSITLEFPSVNSTINAGTNILFRAQEPNMLAIDLLLVYWDYYGLEGNISLNWDTYGYFRMTYLEEINYIHGSTATVIIIAIDVVGNYFNYTFDFIVDIEDPITTVWYYNTTTEYFLPVNDGAVYSGNTIIKFNNTSTDILEFWLRWDTDEYDLLNETGLDNVPFDDGVHTLEILLYDSTGEGTSPNKFHTQIIFYADDLHIDFIDPTELNDTSIFSIEYKQTFNLTVDVYDYAEDIAIVGLNSSVLENDLGLNVNWANDSRIFQFSILATNVTPFGQSYSTVVIEFSINGINQHKITLNLFVDHKDETLFTVLEESNLSAVWEENISVSFTLQDEFNSYLDDIIRVEVNGTEIIYAHLGGNNFGFNYSSKILGAKGDYTLNVSVYSMYYKGQVEIEIEILPLELIFYIEVSNLEIIIDSQLVMTATLTYLNGTGVGSVEILFTVYVFGLQNGASALIEGFDSNETISAFTNSTGHAERSFSMTGDIDHVRISATFEGNYYTDNQFFEFKDNIIAISGGLSPFVLYSLIGGSILVVLAAIFIGIKLSKTKPFEDYLEEIPEDEITNKLVGINPGAFLIIFDQRKGAIPVVHDHDLDAVYKNRIHLDSENFMLKISDQAFSSLGFEDVGDRRRIGTILLPNEKMIGYIQGIQIPIPSARGGFENLAIVVLVNEEYDNALLGNQTYLYSTIDILEKDLKEQQPLVEIRQSLARIRRETTRIVLADLAQTEKNKKE